MAGVRARSAMKTCMRSNMWVARAPREPPASRAASSISMLGGWLGRILAIPRPAILRGHGLAFVHRSFDTQQGFQPRRRYVALAVKQVTNPESQTANENEGDNQCDSAQSQSA